jgi:hypothetical protein
MKAKKNIHITNEATMNDPIITKTKKNTTTIYHVEIYDDETGIEKKHAYLYHFEGIELLFETITDPNEVIEFTGTMRINQKLLYDENNEVMYAQELVKNEGKEELIDLTDEKGKKIPLADFNIIEITNIKKVIK